MVTSIKGGCIVNVRCRRPLLLRESEVRVNKGDS